MWLPVLVCCLLEEEEELLQKQGDLGFGKQKPRKHFMPRRYFKQGNRHPYRRHNKRWPSSGRKHFMPRKYFKQGNRHPYRRHNKRWPCLWKKTLHATKILQARQQTTQEALKHWHSCGFGLDAIWYGSADCFCYVVCPSWYSMWTGFSLNSFVSLIKRKRKKNQQIKIERKFCFGLPFLCTFFLSLARSFICIQRWKNMYIIMRVEIMFWFFFSFISFVHFFSFFFFLLQWVGGLSIKFSKCQSVSLAHVLSIHPIPLFFTSFTNLHTFEKWITVHTHRMLQWNGHFIVTSTS